MTPPVTLRPYQVEQVTAVMRDLFQDRVRSTLVVAATGSGKTSAASEIIRQAREIGANRILVLAHRRELLDQLAERLGTFGVTVTRDVKRAGSIGSFVLVTSTISIYKRLASIAPDAFDLIVYDECHHAQSACSRALLSHLSGARVVGFTATSDRADGRPLGDVFDRVAHRYDIDQAIADEFLVPVRGIRVVVPGMDLSKVRSRRQRVDGSLERGGETTDLLAPAGQARIAPSQPTPWRNGYGSAFGVPAAERYSIDLHPGDLGRAVIEPEAVEGVVGPLLELAGERRTVVFAVDIAHALAIVECINHSLPGTARVVHGKMKAKERAQTLADFQTGRFQYLANCVLLTEGWDCPGVECVAMARPTMSRVIWSQACGRGLRLCEGKEDCLVLDFVGVSCEFNLVGPEDVLGAALRSMEVVGAPVAEPDVFRAGRTGDRGGAMDALEALGYVPSGRTYDYDATEVELVRGADEAPPFEFKSHASVRYETEKAARAEAKAAKPRGWLSRLFGIGKD